MYLLFLAVLGLGCCVGFSLVAVSRGYSLVEHGLLIVVASLVAEHRLQGVQASAVVARGLSSCGIWAQLLYGMQDLPGSGIKPIPCTGRQILNHWTTRDTLEFLCKYKHTLCCPFKLAPSVAKLCPTLCDPMASLIHHNYLSLFLFVVEQYSSSMDIL